MNSATWTSKKSYVMDEIRKALKLKPEPGKPTPSRKEANRTWREDILGIRSEDQRKADKERRQKQLARRAEADEQ